MKSNVNYKPLNLIEFFYQIIGVGRHHGCLEDEISVSEVLFAPFGLFSAAKQNKTNLCFYPGPILQNFDGLYKC